MSVNNVRYKYLTTNYRKVIVQYISRCDYRMHVITFKNCTLIQASNVYKAYARVFNWFFVGYDVLTY